MIEDVVDFAVRSIRDAFTIFGVLSALLVVYLHYEGLL